MLRTDIDNQKHFDEFMLLLKTRGGIETYRPALAVLDQIILTMNQTLEYFAKCNGPIDMAEPHIAYGLMAATKISKPWLNHLNVHYAEYLCAVVCPKCGGLLMETEWQVEKDEVSALESANVNAKETVLCG